MGIIGCVNGHNYNMLRLLRRRVMTAHTLKRCTYSRPEEIEWLRNKFYSNPKYMDKLEYLSRLEKENSLGNFFGNKSIDLLSEEEIYYLLSSEMDYRVEEKGKLELMAKINSTYFKCLIAKQFRWINEVQQCLILINFNQELFQMPPTEISFCLEIISDFPGIRNELDKDRLLNRLTKLSSDDANIYNLILISGYLLEMGIVLGQVLNLQNFQRWFSKNDNFDFRAIYFLHKCSQKLNYLLSAAQKALLNNYMKVAILKLKINYFENNYLVFLLQYYPQYVKTLNILHFTPRAYTGYLLFYKQNPDVKIDPHHIPHSVIQLTSIYAFRTIIELRMALSLDNPLTLAKSFPHFFAHSLKAVNSFISYLKDNRIDDLEVEFYVEKAVESKLSLNQEFTVGVSESYSVNEVITLFAHLSRNRMCSVSFWMKAVKMLERMIEANKEGKLIESRNENYINLLSIATTKNFKEQIREALYKELLHLLTNTNNDWTVKALVKVTRILANNKIGEEQVWLSIEKRISRYLETPKQSEAIGEVLKDNLVKMMLCFNMMDKGSFRFWTMMNEALDAKAKREVLARVKASNTLAHIHLKP